MVILSKALSSLECSVAFWEKCHALRNTKSTCLERYHQLIESMYAVVAVEPLLKNSTPSECNCVAFEGTTT